MGFAEAAACDKDAEAFAGVENLTLGVAEADGVVAHAFLPGLRFCVAHRGRVFVYLKLSDTCTGSVKSKFLHGRIWSMCQAPQLSQFIPGCHSCSM